MDSKLQFQKKLAGLLTVAEEKGRLLEVKEIDAYFAEDALTEEQIELVYDYLLSQKVAVKGYVKLEKEPAEEIPYTEAELAYLEEYERELEEMRPTSEAESYLKDVLELAKEMRHPDLFLGDLVQEGNMSLLLYLGEASEEKKTKEDVLLAARQGMQMLIEEQVELKSRDQKMVEKVEKLDEAIKQLTEELGRKVSLEELALHMELSEEEIQDILKLAGEEEEDEKED